MDRTEQPVTKSATQQPVRRSLGEDGPPAQLFAGQHEELIIHTKKLLQTTFCLYDGCGSCVSCRQIEQEQHHAVRWFQPTKQYYVLDDLTDILETVSFNLAHDQQFFFILQQADLLSTACSNSLLKSLEEPPPGYHFILLSERPNQLLITIRSRCVVTNITTQQDTVFKNPLFELFTSLAPANPSLFLSILSKAPMTETATKELLDKLLAYWMKLYRTALINNQPAQQKTAQGIIKKLENALQKPPMPGSSKIFLKNLFLLIK